MVARYCTACGNELAQGGAFCSSCGRPVHETARVDTSHANTQVSPPPYQPQPTLGYPQQPGGSVGQTDVVRTRNYWITFVVLAVLVLLLGADGTLAVLIGVITATVWVYRDARSRGMEGAAGWAVGVFLLFIVVFPLYFFKRRPRV